MSLLKDEMVATRNEMVAVRNEMVATRSLLKDEMVALRNDIQFLKVWQYRTPYFPSIVAEQHKKLIPFKNKHADDVFVICGSGPTLNYYSPIHDAVHLGLNSVYENNSIKLDYIFAWDFIHMSRIDSRFYEKIREYPAQKILGRYLHEGHPQINEQMLTDLNAVTVFSSALIGISELGECYQDPIIHYDIEHYPLMDFGSCAFGAFHFALYTGAKRILLVGIDNSLNGYFKKEHKQVYFKTDRLLEGWKKVKAFCDIYYPDVEIVSVNPVGLTGIFKDVYTEEYLSLHPELRRPSTEILNI
jgi:hypothetical protein